MTSKVDPMQLPLHCGFHDLQIHFIPQASSLRFRIREGAYSPDSMQTTLKFFITCFPALAALQPDNSTLLLSLSTLSEKQIDDTSIEEIYSQQNPWPGQMATFLTSLPAALNILTKLNKTALTSNPSTKTPRKRRKPSSTSINDKSAIKDH